MQNIIIAILTFPFVALALSMPYFISQYRKLGSVPFWKSFVFYAFVFYCIAAFYMVILPLPESHHGISKTPQLIPFAFVSKIIKASAESHFNLLVPQTWVAFFKHSATYTVLFNVLLTVPLGMMLRYFFKRKWWQAMLIGFCVSLFFELTQLSGLWFLYDYAYRLFDVDDLMVNTFGCMVGFWIMKPLSRHLPNFENLEASAILKGAKQASFTRRLVGFTVDIAFTVGCFIGISYAIVKSGVVVSHTVELLLLMALVGIFFMLVPSITHGQTLGLMIVKLRIYHLDGTTALPINYVERYGLFIWLFLIGPLWLLVYAPNAADGVAVNWFILILITIYGTWLISVAVRAIRSAMHHPFLMLNGVISNTTVMTAKQANTVREEKKSAAELARNSQSEPRLEQETKKEIKQEPEPKQELEQETKQDPEPK